MDKCRHLLREPLPPGAAPLQLLQAFKQSINMSRQELEEHLSSRASQEVAQDPAGDEEDHEGRHIARRIIELLDKDDGTGELYWEGDLSHMHQVSKYIDCHRAALRAAGAAGPAGGGGGGGEEADRLRHRLMNYGFDPLKEREAGSGA